MLSTELVNRNCEFNMAADSVWFFQYHRNIRHEFSNECTHSPPLKGQDCCTTALGASVIYFPRKIYVSFTSECLRASFLFSLILIRVLFEIENAVGPLMCPLWTWTGPPEAALLMNFEFMKLLQLGYSEHTKCKLRIKQHKRVFRMARMDH